jgi:hypothetical protein
MQLGLRSANGMVRPCSGPASTTSWGAQDKEHASADIHHGPEHNTLQSEAGYIDARPHLPG